ncbi:GNAT family N-acetyltransferase [Neorhizobium galegae]|uniref:GNAT family N-acetyltransferase n=1 Tax=Neorhizobium galegae TaxID=399 RepID=UPI002106F7F0|nr:GNAT family N-acetyltransferase [Neorhizobium galegae]MCQ1836918.1 GNAT family N-acetyltransferase [Neorhizobium galegae]UIY30891.1 GNAT family N-acetyltransferase [Neorhizobium galegae]
MPIPPRRPLKTERLVLRPTTGADAGRGFEIQSDWEVTRMLRMAAFPPDLPATETWFADHEREWLAGEACRFAVDVEGRMIGLVDIDEIADGEGELGYWFERAAWGSGYASEAARAAIRFAFEGIGLSVLKSGHAQDNPASGRILVKLGFRHLDTVDRFSRPRAENIRQCRYVLAPSG